MSDWQRERKIVSIRPTNSGPVAYLAQLLEQAQAGKIKQVAVVVQYDDDNVVAGSMQMPVRDLVFMERVLKGWVDHCIQCSSET